MREKVIENKIKDYLTSNNIYHFKVHGDNYTQPGIPDLVCCWKGRFLGIEVKRVGAKNHQTEQQKIHERNIQRSGGIYLLVESVQEVIDFLKE